MGQDRAEPGYRRNTNGLCRMCVRVHPGDRINDFAGSDEQDRSLILACCLTSVAWAAATAAQLPIAGLALFDSVRTFRVAVVCGRTRYDTSR